MSANVFFDTNIIIYSYSNSEPEKQTIARHLIGSSNGYVSTQVLQELINIVTKKFKFSYENACVAVNECCKNNQLYVNTFATILDACSLANKYHFSFYDSLVISAAIACDCSILYSEDMHHGLLVENKIRIINPFFNKATT